MAGKIVDLSPDPNLAPGGARDLSSNNPDYKKYLWTGRIVHVDSETMCCSISTDSGIGEFHDIPLPASGGSGPRSWSGVVPEPGTRVVIGWRKYGNRNHLPVIIETLTSGVFSAREYEPFATVSPEEAEEAINQVPDIVNDPKYNFGTVRLKLRKAYPGDFLASSSGGADIYLDKDVNLSNRAGNEFILRDADQTAVLQTVNEYTTNAAGSYRRGLIKRNAFTFPQDIFPLDDKTSGLEPYNIEVDDPTYFYNQKVPKDSPAYPILLGFNLIKEDGSKVFDAQQGITEYPYVVTSDGQRINYIVTGENENSFSDWPHAYIEDRKELRHISDGVMSVTEEGDGFQIDPREVFIEDVHGTVVGNDFSSTDGQRNYKRILKMDMFPSPYHSEPIGGPNLTAVDNMNQEVLDSVALARLYRIQSPNNSNQYVFGVNKEGRVFLHVPSSKTAETPNDTGRSVDFHAEGLVKAIVGKDPGTELSTTVNLIGGAQYEIGRGPKGVSVDTLCHGPVNLSILGGDYTNNTPAYDIRVDGSCSRTMSGTDFMYSRGTSVRKSGAGAITEGDSISHVAGFGGYKVTSSGDLGFTVLGKTMEMYAQVVMTNFALGNIKLTLAGVDTHTMLAGAITRTLVAGAGITDTVATGNIALSVGIGNVSTAVGTGNVAVTSGVGNLALTAGAGPIAITSSLATTLTAGVATSITSPTTKIGIAVVGVATAGVPGPPGPHLDFITGLPIFGVPTIAIG